MRSVFTGPIHKGSCRRVSERADLNPTLGPERRRVVYSDGTADIRELAYAGATGTFSAEDLALMLTQRQAKNRGDAQIVVVVCDIQDRVAPIKHAEQKRRDDDKVALAKLRPKEGALGPLPSQESLLSGRPLGQAELALYKSVTPFAEARCTRGWFTDLVYGLMMANFQSAQDPLKDASSRPALVIDGVDWRGVDHLDARCVGTMSSDPLLGLLLSRRGLPWDEVKASFAPQDLAGSQAIAFDEEFSTYRLETPSRLGVRFFPAPSYPGNYQGESDVRILSMVAHIHMLRECEVSVQEATMRELGASDVDLKAWLNIIENLNKHLLVVNDADYVCTSLAMLCNISVWQEARNRDFRASTNPPSSHKRTLLSTSAAEPASGAAPPERPKAPEASKRARKCPLQSPAALEASDPAQNKALQVRAVGEFGAPLASAAPRVFVCLAQRGKTNAAELFKDVHARAKCEGASEPELEAVIRELERAHSSMFGAPMVVSVGGRQCTARSAGLLFVDTNLLLEQLLAGTLGPGRFSMSAELRARVVESLLGAWSLAGNDFVARGMPGAHADLLYYAFVELTRQALVERAPAEPTCALAPFADPQARGPAWAEDFLGGVALKALSAAQFVTAALGSDSRVMTRASEAKVKKMVAERAPFLAQSARTARYWFLSSTVSQPSASLEAQARTLAV